MSLDSLIINLSKQTLDARIQHWETELAHCIHANTDPLEALEWLDLYRREVARRYPTIQFRWRQ